jgi:hypothetical protein
VGRLAAAALAAPVGALLAAASGCNYITDGFTTNDFSGDPFPFGVETESGAIVIGMQPVGDTIHAATLDVLSPLTVIDHGADAAPTIAYPNVVLDGTRFAGGPLDLPRAELDGPQLLTLHPCAEAGCSVGPEAAPRSIAAVVGMNSFGSDALRLDLSSDQIFILPDIAGSDTDRSYACDAVMPLAFRGGGTLLVGGTELSFSNWRIVVDACADENPDENVFQSERGVDLLLVVSTGVGPSLIGKSAYARYTAFDPTAPPYDPTQRTTVFLSSGPVSGFATTLPKIALAGNSTAFPRAPCRQVYASHLLAEQYCPNPSDTDQCPCPDGANFCPVPAVIEVTPAARLPVLVLDDADPVLQSLRAELRPNEPEIDGILGTSALQGVELDIDYPHDRLLARCTDPATCSVRPELDGSSSERLQVQGCLGLQ